jgi:hypothetical protein
MSVSADACPAILGSDGAPVLVSVDAVVTPVVSSSDDVVSSVGMEGAGIVVPSLSVDEANVECVDDPLEVAPPVNVVDLSRVEVVPLNAECGVGSPLAVPQQANEAAGVDSDVHVEDRTLVPVADGSAPPSGDVLNERTCEVPSPINIVASSVDEMSSLPSVGPQSCWVLPDARLVFALVVSIIDNADEPVPLPLEPRTLKFLELAVEFDLLQRSYQAGVPTPSPWPQPIPLAATISGVNAALGSMRMGLYTMPELVAYIWRFLTPGVANHVGTLLAKMHFQISTADAVSPCFQGKPGVPTIEEVRGGDIKIPEAEGFLLSDKGSFTAVEAEPLVVFSGKGAATKKSTTAKVPVVEGKTKVETVDSSEGVADTSGGAVTATGAGASAATGTADDVDDEVRSESSVNSPGDAVTSVDAGGLSFMNLPSPELLQEWRKLSGQIDYDSSDSLLSSPSDLVDHADALETGVTAEFLFENMIAGDDYDSECSD